MGNLNFFVKINPDINQQKKEDKNMPIIINKRSS